MGFVVVLMTSIDLYVLQPFDLSGGANTSILRLVRMSKLARSLKVARAAKLFAEIRVLLATVAASLKALFWSMILLALLMFMGAVMLCQACQMSLQEDSKLDFETKAW